MSTWMSKNQRTDEESDVSNISKRIAQHKLNSEKNLGFLPVVLVVTNRNHNKPQDESFQVLNELQEQDNIYHYWKKVMDSFQRIETD